MVTRKRTYVPDDVLAGVGVTPDANWSGDVVWVKRSDGHDVEYVLRSVLTTAATNPLAPPPATGYIRQPGITTPLEDGDERRRGGAPLQPAS